MKDVRDNAFSFLDDWYGRLDDIIEDLKEHGFDVLNATAEWIDVSDADDKEYVIKLDGTERTITIKSIEALNESLIPIQEYCDEDEWDDDELANIYGGDTAQSQKDIAEDEIAALKSEAFDDWKEPKLGKKIKQLKGWKIYQGTDSSGDETFRCFTPDEYRPEVGYEDWECETLEQAISWVQNYDLEESKKCDNDINADIINEDSDDDLIVVEYITTGNDDVDIQKRIAKIRNAIEYYENNDDDTLYNLIDKLEDELEDLKDINMKNTTKIDESKNTLIETDTFGNYEENVFTALDNIEFLATSYEELNKNSLGSLISKLKDEVDTLEKIHMKLVTGIQQYDI